MADKKIGIWQGEWFKIGVSVQNDTDTDIDVYVEVDGVEVRIEQILVHRKLTKGRQ